jgi:predicted HAD superfamily phosphohydrolase YqeG
VLGGNRAGFLTIMTKIIDNNEAINIRIKRIFEKVVMKKFERKIKKI